MAVLTDTEELQAAWRAFAGQTSNSGISTILIGPRGSRFRAGVAHDGGEEVLLAGFNLLNAPMAKELPEGHGFRVEVSTEHYADGFQYWLCLTRQPGASLDLFGQMAADIMASLGARSGLPDARLVTLMLARIRTWQDFMTRPVSAIMSPQAELGLTGELLVLRKLVRGGVSPQVAAAAWQGPAGGLRDFETQNYCLEVKTTLSVNGFLARISSLEQLDDGIAPPVLLVGMRLCLQANGETLPDIIRDVRTLVADSKVAASDVERNLLLARFSDATASDYTRQFVISDCRVFDVAGSFPRLARTQTRPEILAAAYDLDLDLIQEPAMDLTNAINEFGVFA